MEEVSFYLYSPTDFSNFKIVNNQLRNLTRNQKKNYEKQLIQKMKSKPKAFWQYINSKVKTRPNITKLLHSDDTAASSDTERQLCLMIILLVFLPAKIPPSSLQ